LTRSLICNDVIQPGRILILREKAMPDIRLDQRGAWVLQQVIKTQSLTLKTIGGKRGGEVAVNRFLGNRAVTPASILGPEIARTRAAAVGRSILAVQDTTEVNFAGRARRRKGLGPTNGADSPGFFIHPQIAVDAETGAVLGLCGAAIWTRAPGTTGVTRKRASADKESRRWLEGARCASQTLAGAATRIVVVGDRESDIYWLFANRPAGTELLVRAAQDRALEDGGHLKTADTSWPVLATADVRVAAKRIGAKGGPQPERCARAEVRSGPVEVRAPRNGLADASAPDTVALQLVSVREIDPPPGAEPLVWWLLTTLPAATAQEALETVRLYRLRWRIEEVFRVLKTDGLDLEASQVTQSVRLFNLAAVGLIASVRILQLTDARDGSSRPATDVIDAAALPAAAAIGRTLEGGTARQRNPFDHGSLAWLSWIVARLGGWNCYYRPPGPKTMANGWRRLAERLAGFDLAETLRDV
jgi:Transposase DDE domain